MTDRTHDGKAFRMLAVINEYTRECPAIHVRRYRPLIALGNSSYLFTGPNTDRPKRSNTLSKQLKKLIRHSVGLEVNPHLYRHLVHLIVLNQFPGAYSMVSRILGHKSLQTVIHQLRRRRYRHRHA